MKHTIIAIAALLAAAGASATVCTPATPQYCATPTGSTITGTQSQQQTASALAGASATSVSGSHSNATGGAAGASVAGSGNSSVTVQGAQPGSGDRYLSVALPSPAPAIAPTMVAGAVTMVSMGCGTLVREVADNVTTYETGMWGGTTERTVRGTSYRPYMDEFGLEVPYRLIDGRWYGHEVLVEAAVIANSSGASLSAALFGSSRGGSGGVALSGGTTAMAGKTMYRLCALPVAAPVIVFEQRPVPRAKPRPAPRAKGCPVGQVLVCRFPRGM